MSGQSTVVLIPGSWHKPACYTKIEKILHDKFGIKCTSVTLPSTADDPNATFKDDIDAARHAIESEIAHGHDVVVVAHSYGGMVGNSAIKGLTRPKTSAATQLQPHDPPSGFVTALVLIASGFTITGLSFMDPLFGITPPSWRVDKATGYATLVTDPRDLFYHDLSDIEAEYWVNQLTTQSLKALFEGGEHAYAGWRDVPTWYIGTVEDRGLPVVLQRVQVGMARGQSDLIHHIELKSSHSPFLSMPQEVAEIIADAASIAAAKQVKTRTNGVADRKDTAYRNVPTVRLGRPDTWVRFGIPFAIGRALGWGFTAFMWLKKTWSK